MLYRICPECGCALDPDEQCDCQKSMQLVICESAGTVPQAAAHGEVAACQKKMS